MTSETVVMEDGIIERDSDQGKRFGFTSDRFGSGSYLWKRGRDIAVSFIISLECGNFRKLAQSINDAGFTVKVPNPTGRMQQIVRGAGYQKSFEYSKEFGEHVEVWFKHPQSDAEDERDELLSELQHLRPENEVLKDLLIAASHLIKAATGPESWSETRDRWMVHFEDLK